MKQKVILISGLLESGKSTLANELFWSLENEVAYGSEDLYCIMYRYAFADKVKEIAEKEFGWDGKKDDKGRRLLQRIGTEVGRDYNKDIWVDYFSDFMNDNTNEDRELPTLFIIDDWRFKNEAENINFDYEGSTYTIRVRRDIERDEDQLNHASEKGLPTDPEYYDFVFDNNYDNVEDISNSDQYKKLLEETKIFLKK